MPHLVNNEDIRIGDVYFAWSIPEYEEHDRTRAWFVIMLVAGALFVLYAIVTSNFLFALIVVLFGIILFLQSHQKPIIIPFQITELGIVLNNRFYPYDELQEFFMVYSPPDVKMLFVETKSHTRPRLRIPLMDMDPNEIRATLREFLPENVEKAEEPFSDMFARKWMLH